MGEPASPSWLEWGAAGRALPGEAESADRHVVSVRGETAIAAVVDGLGHGRDAVRAARTAVETLEASPETRPLELVQRCHAALAGTRGAVMTLAVLDHGRSTLAWLGLGDVEGILHRADGGHRETVLLRAGILGDRIPPLRASELPLAPGDTLILASDGIRRAFVDEPVLKTPPREVADRILRLHARDTDDALVLVVRYRGRVSP